MASDPFDGDPYRTAPLLAAPEAEAVFRVCPRCADLLTRHFRVFVCTHGCGVWLPIDLVFEIATFEELEACNLDGGTPDPPDPLARCAQCSLLMKLCRHGQLVFDFCPGHGVWLDRGERLDFEHAFTDSRERATAAAVRDELEWLDKIRDRIGLGPVRGWFDEVWRTRAWRPEVQPEVRPDPQPEPQPDADEREELAWLDGARARLDDERG
jgi:Zn-finger nucleic acid-binding protein